jgi:hypothetical protein
MFHYSAYNLAISSEICLPELPIGPPGTGLDIRLSPAGAPITARSIDWREAPAKEACFYFIRVAQFRVRDGREVIVTPDPKADQTIFPLYIQGMMLASTLHQRGFFVLHASVIDFEGSAIALMGPIGAGKSTFASAFQARGHRILADDNAALQMNGVVPYVLPAFPTLKVYPDVARSLGHREVTLTPTHHSQVKCAQSVAHAFCCTPRPLDAIYVLDRDALSGISALSPIESITELIRHSVPTRWGVNGNACHLRQCAHLAQRVPMFRVRTFTQLSEIPEIAEQIERDPARRSEPAADRNYFVA